MSLRTFWAAACAASLLAIPALADGIKVTDPYARAASPSAKAGAVFMMLSNESGQDDRLIAARSDAAKRVEIHTHKDTGDGVMKMVEIEAVDLPAGATHHLMRGADHVMLMGLTGPLEQGAEIEVILVFEEAGEMTLTVPVDNERKPAKGAHAHGHGG